MKKLFIVASLLMANHGYAATYNCSVETADGSKPLFSIDSEKQDNAFAPFPGEGTAGCVILRSEPALLACTMGFEKHSSSVTAVSELGSSLLSVQAASGENKISLQCLKR